MILLSTAVLAWADEGPLQELAVGEHPYLQQPLELQVTGAGDWRGVTPGSDGVGGAVGFEVGLVRRTQLGLTVTDEALEGGLGLALLTLPDGLHLSVLIEAERAWTEARAIETGGWVTAAHPLGPAFLAGAVGIAVSPSEPVAPRLSFGVAWPVRDWVPFAEAMVEPALADRAVEGAAGVRWHPLEPLELGSSAHWRSGPSLDLGVSLIATVEVGLLGEER